MPQILDNRTSLDQTVRIFDSFYSFSTVVGAVEYDIVSSYFVSVCSTKNIADNFTAVLFRISQETQIPVIQLLDQIKGKKKMEMNQILAYYLNSFKSKTSLYGISIVPRSNQPVARNIVQ
jgi:pyruvate/2-oxoacid:ferredoxin oxidoreductase alpha subunit